VEPFDRVIPTVENIGREVWRRLHAPLTEAGVKLHAIRLWETADLFVDVYGDSE